MRQPKAPVTQELLSWCQSNQIYVPNEVARCLRYSSAKKLIDYIAQQKVSFPKSRSTSYVFHLYQDYVQFCEDLHYDLTDDFVVYPRNLQEAHDNTSVVFDKHKMQIFNDKIAAEYPALSKKYDLCDHGLKIVVPKSADELIAEGHTLHHCVGNYVARVAKKESTILFLRTEEQPETPFYTIELIDGTIAQVRGDNNCDPSPAVNAYMALWKQEKLLPALQEAA